MRSIASSLITGGEAIMIAALEWWIKESDLAGFVQKWLADQPPTVFLIKREPDIGKVVTEKRPFTQNFWSDVKSNPSMKFMTDYARSDWTSGERIENFVEHQLNSAIGSVVRQTDWFERNKREIDAEKRKVKTIREVMDS